MLTMHVDVIIQFRTKSGNFAHAYIDNVVNDIIVHTGKSNMQCNMN